MRMRRLTALLALIVLISGQLVQALPAYALPAYTLATHTAAVHMVAAHTVAAAPTAMQHANHLAADLQTADPGDVTAREQALEHHCHEQMADTAAPAAPSPANHPCPQDCTFCAACAIAPGLPVVTAMAPTAFPTSGLQPLLHSRLPAGRSPLPPAKPPRA